MSALRQEIKRLLAEYNRTEPIEAVEALVLRECPELATLTDLRGRAFVRLEIMLAANRLLKVGQQETAR